MELIKLIFYGGGCRLVVWCNVLVYNFFYIRKRLICLIGVKDYLIFNCIGEV